MYNEFIGQIDENHTIPKETFIHHEDPQISSATSKLLVISIIK